MLQEQGENHAPFKLTSSGEKLWLLDTNMTVVDAVEYGPLDIDQSWGCMDAGCAVRGELVRPTPGRANLLGNPTRSATPRHNAVLPSNLPLILRGV